MKLTYQQIVDGIEFVIAHKSEIEAAVKAGRDLVEWLEEKFGSHAGLTDVERALLVKTIGDLTANESQAPPLEPPPAPPADPTTVAYDSIDAAKAHLTGYYTIVIEKDGKFYVWPGAFPHTGTKVYPE